MNCSTGECHTDTQKKIKQKQAILYAIEKYEGINRTKLMKYIFFIDLYYYNIVKETLLEDCYIRLPNGPVPKFGFEYTTPPHKNEKSSENEDFIINKITSGDENSEYYHYQFILKPGVQADMSIFQKGEIDLLNLTLETIISRRTAYLSKLSHTYDLWRDYENGATIGKDDFSLSPDEMKKLDLLLHTKIYLNPLNSDISVDNTQIEEGMVDNTGKFPSKLPIYINTNTGKEIQDKKGNN